MGKLFKAREKVKEADVDALLQILPKALIKQF